MPRRGAPAFLDAATLRLPGRIVRCRDCGTTHMSALSNARTLLAFVALLSGGCELDRGLPPPSTRGVMAADFAARGPDMAAELADFAPAPASDLNVAPDDAKLPLDLTAPCKRWDLAEISCTPRCPPMFICVKDKICLWCP